MDILYWMMVATGALFFVVTLFNLGRVYYYTRKKEKIVCPHCQEEIIKMGKNFTCYNCKKKISTK